MKKPIAVLISDVHYNLHTLEIANAAMRLAIDKANILNIPLVVAGDLHDSKANMRAECVNAMLKTFALKKNFIYVSVGNHDKINEKSVDNSLDFLQASNSAIVISEVTHVLGGDWTLIPYYHDPEELKEVLKNAKKYGHKKLIMHQGISGSKSGEYIQDHSAIHPEDVAGMRVISGHYHTRQTIDLPDGGKWDYIGNPYTLNYGEAKDPEKGFQILYDDGSLEFVPTNLRKHVIIEAEEGIRHYSSYPEPDDLVWIKASGTKEWLSTQTKEKLRKQTGVESFRLDLIPLDQETKSPLNQTMALTQSEQFDELISSLSNTRPEARERLKALWKAL